jgi:hypothetical protein
MFLQLRIYLGIFWPMAHDQKNAAAQAAVAGGYYDDLHRLI